MAAYVVLWREGPIHTPSEMEEYRRTSPPPDPRMKPLVVYGAQEHIEGSHPPEGVVVLEFPSMEDARDWYNGPYNAAAQHRLAAADYRGVIVEGFEMPTS